MTYRNTKTGAVIDTAAAVSGGYWQEVMPSAGTKPGAPAQAGKTDKPAGKKTAAKGKQ